MEWVEARNAAKLPIIHKTVPAIKNYLTPNLNSAKVLIKKGQNRE
jgi:hypothetical protein